MADITDLSKKSVCKKHEPWPRVEHSAIIDGFSVRAPSEPKGLSLDVDTWAGP